MWLQSSLEKLIHCALFIFFFPILTHSHGAFYIWSYLKIKSFLKYFFWLLLVDYKLDIYGNCKGFCHMGFPTRHPSEQTGSAIEKNEDHRGRAEDFLNSVHRYDNRC